MNPDYETRYLTGLTFQKSASEIKEKLVIKINLLKAKIVERQARIVQARTEYGIDDGALIALLNEARNQSKTFAKMSYTISSISNSSVPNGSKMEERTIGAGVVNLLLTEGDYIETEKQQVSRLELILRNLRPIESTDTDGIPSNKDAFTLSESDLKYLNF